MFDWFGSKKEVPKENSYLQRAERFIAEYNISNEQDRYAMFLWGVVTIFNKIFGSLDNFHSAEPEKRKRYLRMIGSSSIKELEDGKIISSSCKNFYLNYLMATNGLGRTRLRGSIEQVADMLDGIVRHGSLKLEQVGAMEEAARAHLSTEAPFTIGSGVVKGAVTERTVAEVSAIVLRDLQQILQTREDYYWFTIEQHDLLLSRSSAIRTMLDDLPLFPIEYEGMRSADSYVGRPNPGVEYIASIRSAIRNWCAIAVPTLNPDELSTRVITAAYGHFRMAGKQALDELRLEYAVHYHNNCVASGGFRNADKWNEVIAALS